MNLDNPDIYRYMRHRILIQWYKCYPKTSGELKCHLKERLLLKLMQRKVEHIILVHTFSKL
jgi:hypothetical protein